MNVDQLINSLCRGDDDAATFRRIEVDPGEPLADTTAQSGVIDIRPFRKAEEALFHKFGLKPRVIPGDNQAVGIGGKAKVLGKVEMRSGMGGVNGTVKYTVVDSPAVPPLTPASLLQQVGAVIDLNSNTMYLKKIETTTTLRALPSGHVAHKLTEFAPGGWKAPTPEQTELLQVRTELFCPVTLPGEFKPRSSKHCAGFSSGFVYPVRDRSHLCPSHHQHDPELCVDDTVSCDLFSDDQLARGTSNFECHLLLDSTWMPTQRWRSCVLVAEVPVPGSRHPSVVAERAGLVATTLLKNRSNRVHTFAGTPGPSRQPVGLNGGVRQETREMRRHRELLPLSCIDRSQRGKGQDERKEERYHHDQPKSRTDCRGCLYQEERGRCLSEMRPRTSCLQHRFGAHLALPWMESRRNTVYLGQSVPRRSRRPWRVKEYGWYRRWKFSEWFWWPRNTPKTSRWHTRSTSYKRLDGPGASSSGKPSLGSGKVRSAATCPQQYQHLQLSTAARGVVDNGSLASASRGRRIHWGPVEYGHGNGSDWCVIAQPNTTSESESMNHRQDWCGNAWSNDEVKDEPVLTASHVLKEHPLEKRQEDKVPKLDATIREFGHAIAHWPSCGLRQKPETGLVSSMF